MPQKHKYLDPEILSQLGPLDIIARQVVEGVRIGMHRSPLRGISTEFTAYRQYVPGDEVKHIDWKAYARVNRYYVKLFEAETNFIANLLIDSSKSMTFASGKVSKLEYAKYMAASLAYLVVDQHDSVGVGVFDEKLQNYIEPKSTMGVLVDISNELEKTESPPKTNVGAIMHEFANRMRRRGFVMLFSDLFDVTDEFIEGINHLRFRGHNVVVFHVLDDHELTFPLNGMWKFVGLEGEGELVTQPSRVRHNYLKELESFVNKSKTACMKAGADYVLVNTADPIEQVLIGYLLQRSFAARTGR
ncbi:MAG: DUF58 domain-containing protein [Kiritimatiellia bacterium]|jgi:uncharacterized protein (DUF58 family)|nr:DUF58 domain-containing protein [Kiritimatiellia bacterium]